MKYLRYFETINGYSSEESLLPIPSVSLVKEDHSLKYKSLGKMKDDVVAWYSPRTQGISQYDVIESYTEDFTKAEWNKSGSITDSSNLTVQSNYIKLVTVDSTSKSGSIIYKNNVFRIEPMTLFIRGINEGDVIRYDYYIDDNTKKSINLSNGINNLPASIATQSNADNVAGLYGSINTKSTIHILQLPTSKIRDLSKNNHNLYLHGFKGAYNSGIGLYRQNFKEVQWGGVVHENSTKTYNKLHIVKNRSQVGINFGYVAGILKTKYDNSSKYSIRVTSNATKPFILSIVSSDGNLNSTHVTRFTNITSGNICEVPVIPEEIFNKEGQIFIYYDINSREDMWVDIELIPEYSDQLCYSGNEYGISYDLPILTDYTCIIRRTWINILDNSCLASKRLVIDGVTDDVAGAFSIEYRKQYSTSFGVSSAIQFSSGVDEVIVQSKEKYNSTVIKSGDGIDSNILILGGNNDRGNQIREPFIGAISDFILFNRTLTDEEISKVKSSILGIKE